MRPRPDDTVCDPACGTGGFLLAAHDYVVDHHGKDSTRTRRSTCARLRARLGAGPRHGPAVHHEPYLHGIDADPCPVASGRRQPGRATPASGSAWC